MTPEVEALMKKAKELCPYTRESNPCHIAWVEGFVDCVIDYFPKYLLEIANLDINAFELGKKNKDREWKDKIQKRIDTTDNKFEKLVLKSLLED